MMAAWQRANGGECCGGNGELVQRCDAEPQVSVVQAAGTQGLHRLRDLSKESTRVLSLRT